MMCMEGLVLIPNNRYFNAGVLMINVDYYWQNHNVTPIFMKYIGHNFDILRLQG